MKRILLVFALLSVSCLAQPRSSGYGFIGPATITGYGHSTTLGTAGIGGEWIHARAGLGAGADIGTLFRGGDAQGLALIHGAWHVPLHGSKWDPFVNAGGGVAFVRWYSTGVFHVGAGFQYWLNRHLAPRVEVRPVWYIEGGSPTVQFRFGVAFR